jgi:hypothetical protein
MVESNLPPKQDPIWAVFPPEWALQQKIETTAREALDSSFSQTRVKRDLHICSCSPLHLLLVSYFCNNCSINRAIALVHFLSLRHLVIFPIFGKVEVNACQIRVPRPLVRNRT